MLNFVLKRIIKRVKRFKCLGQILSDDDDDMGPIEMQPTKKLGVHGGGSEKSSKNFQFQCKINVNVLESICPEHLFIRVRKLGDKGAYYEQIE